MSFVVTLIALLIERFFDWSHIRQWDWYLSFQNSVIHRLQGKNAVLILAVTIVPIAAVVGIISYMLHGVLYGLAGLLFDLAVLLYCLGPQNLWADVFASTSALNQGGNDAVAADKLKVAFGIMDCKPNEDTHRNLINNIFIAANYRVFAVVFWYLIAGPMGAVIYRALAVSANAKQETAPEVAERAHFAESILDWLPVRVFTFLFALGGHFTKVFACWRQKLPNGINNNDAILTACGFAALGVDDKASLAVDGTLEKSTVSLLDRTMIILLVIVAIVILLRY